MKIKKEYIILVVLIVLLSLYLVFYKTDKTKYTVPVMPEIAKKEITKIGLSTSQASLTLTRQDSTWAIGPEGYLADSKKINAMLDVIQDLTLTDLVSESKNYVRYELDEEKKITVNAFGGSGLMRSFDIGKTAPSFRHTFVRLAEDPRVFYARDNFKDKFDQTVEKLRDKNVLSFEKTDIQALDIRKGDEVLKLAQSQVPVAVQADAAAKTEAPPQTGPETEMVWQDEKGNKKDASKVNRLLSTLSKLNCSAYLNTANKDDFKTAIYAITLKGAETYSLSVYAKKDKDANEYPAVSSQSNHVFSLSASQADNFMSLFDDKKE